MTTSGAWIIALLAIAPCTSSLRAQVVVDLDPLVLDQDSRGLGVYVPSAPSAPAEADYWGRQSAVEDALVPIEVVEGILAEPTEASLEELLALFAEHLGRDSIRDGVFLAAEDGDEAARKNGGKLFAELYSSVTAARMFTPDLVTEAISAEPEGGHFRVNLSDKIFAFSGAGAPVAPGLPGEPVHYLTPRQAAVTRQIVEALERAPIIVSREARIRVAETLREVDAGWKNYLGSGYSQYPWELLLNGALYSDDAGFEAPRSQLVLLHPEVAALTNPFDGARDADIGIGVMIHGLGYVRYFGDDRSWFAGASMGASIDGDNGLGVGAAVHAGIPRAHENIPHITIGVYWPDFDEGSFFGEGPVIGVSLDLWRYLDSDNGDRLFMGRVRDLLAP